MSTTPSSRRRRPAAVSLLIWTPPWSLVLATALAACGPDAGPAAPGGGAGTAAASGFVESAPAAGLDFHMNFLPAEQGANFRINLYDHGSGVAVCDYDGDGDDDVYLVNQLGANGLFRNDGTGKFADVTAAAGVGLADRICVSAVFADYDNDGDADLFVTSTRGGNVLYRNEGNGKFADVTAAAGVTLVAHSQSATFFDYDLDGDLDLFVPNTAEWTSATRDPADGHFPGAATIYDLLQSKPERNVFYRNDGNGRFTDVTEQSKLAGRGWGGDTTVLDYDDDGRPDLLMAHMFGGTALLRNQGDGTFRDVTAAVLGKVSCGALGTKVMDVDGDGRLDIYVVDMHSDMWTEFGSPPGGIDPSRKYPGPEGPGAEEAARRGGGDLRNWLGEKVGNVLYGNTLYRNLGGGRFEEISEKAGAETFWPWGIAAADFDQDGSVDAYIPTGMGYPFFYWPSSLLMNRGDGTFAERAKELGIEPPPGGQYLKGLIGGRPAPRSTRSAAVGDFDGDGRPDLVVNTFNDRALLYMNRFPARAWVGVRLRGTKSNRDAVGAVVTVTAAGRKFVRLVESSSGYLSQSSRTLRFGLGAATKIESCEIVWPGGRKQTVPATNVKLGTINDIVETE